VFEKELQNIRQTTDLKTCSDLKQQASTTSEPTPSNISDIVAKEIIDQIPSSPDDGDEKRLINLSEVNLHNVGLISLDIEPLKNLKHIKKLILSFNRIKSIKEINNMSSLEYLDASYNQIETLNGLKV
jgi:Leucine-rich repeat (LRR) protein